MSEQLSPILSNVFSSVWPKICNAADGNYGFAIWLRRTLEEPALLEIRSWLEACLEFGQQTGMLDGRIRQLQHLKHNSFWPVVFELGALRFVNARVSKDVQFEYEPQGKGLKRPEAKLKAGGFTLWVEVKTLLNDDESERFESCINEIRRAISTLEAPYAINIVGCVPGQFTHTRLRNHLNETFRNTPGSDENHLYEDPRGLRLTFKVLPLPQGGNVRIASYSRTWWGGKGPLISDSVSKALKQTPSAEPTLVVIAAQGNLRSEYDIEEALFGGPYVRVRIHPESSESEFSEEVYCDLSKALLGPKRNLKCLGVAFYKVTRQGHSIEENFTLIPNPFLPSPMHPILSELCQRKDVKVKEWSWDPERSILTYK